jgi:hypothetical protein
MKLKNLGFLEWNFLEIPMENYERCPILSMKVHKNRFKAVGCSLNG